MSQKATYYEILGVSEAASLDDIRAAFRRLTIKYHPDRFPQEKRSEAEHRFQQITEAFNILSRPDARDAYDKELSMLRRGVGGGGGGTDSVEEARKLTIRGAQAFKEGDLVTARETLRRAVYLDERNAKAHFFLGRTLLKMPGQQRTGLRHIERAVALDPSDLTLKAHAAIHFFEAGMKLRARRLAQEIIAADPTNQRAREVLSLTENSDSETGGSIIGRLKRRGS